jgi:hypothetical protein
VSGELEALSKAGGEILNDPSVREFIGRVTGEPAAELGGLLGDRIRWWRFRQWVKLCVRAKELLDNAGLEAHEVRPGVLVPVLEGGSLADDESPFRSVGQPCWRTPPRPHPLSHRVSHTSSGSSIPLTPSCSMRSMPGGTFPDGTGRRMRSTGGQRPGRSGSRGATSSWRSTTSFACGWSTRRRPTEPSSARPWGSRRSGPNSFARASRPAPTPSHPPGRPSGPPGRERDANILRSAEGRQLSMSGKQSHCGAVCGLAATLWGNSALLY